MTGTEKDAEIIKLNMHLADEKRRLQDIIRTSKSPVPASLRSSAPFGLRYSPPPSGKHDFDASSSQKVTQLLEESEQLGAENQQLRRRLDNQKKQFQLEH